MNRDLSPVREGSSPRSRNSTRHAHVRFINRTWRKVDVIWINYEGVQVKYKTLDPREFFDVTSFVTHPWIFVDAETHTKLVVSNKEVFDIPEPIFVRNPEGTAIPTRACVQITLPLHSLQECAFQSVQKILRDPAHAFDLEIPKFLQRDLYERCINAQQYAIER